ncbi:MAG: hypothetical protein AAB320_00045 [Elusimicrobiota bacterium]
MKRLLLALLALTVPMTASAVEAKHQAKHKGEKAPLRSSSLLKKTPVDLFTYITAKVVASVAPHRCDVELLSAADKRLATDPAAGRKMLEAFFEANSAKLKLSLNLPPNATALNPATVNEICDRAVWSRVHAMDAAQPDPARKFSAISLQEQIPVLLGIDEAFFKLDWQAEATIAKAKEVLAAGEALGLAALTDVKIPKTTRKGGKIEVVEVADKQSTIAADFDLKKPNTKLPVEKQVGAILLLLNEKQQAKPDPIGPMVGGLAKEYHKSVLAFRDSLKTFGSARYVKNDPMLAKLTSNAAATAKDPGQAIDVTGSMASIMAEIAQSKGWKDNAQYPKAALNELDWTLRNRLAYYHSQVEDVIKVLDAKTRAAGGVEAVVRDVKLQVAAARGEQLEKQAQQNAAAQEGLKGDLEAYKTAFQAKLASELFDGIEKREDLTVAQKAVMKETVAASVAKAEATQTLDGKNFVFTVPDTRIRIVTPVPSKADATKEKAEGAAVAIAKSILEGEEFKAKRDAVFGAVLNADPGGKPLDAKLPELPTLTGVATLPAGSPLAKQIADTGCGGPGDIGKSNEARFRDNQMAALGDKWSKYSAGSGKAQTRRDTALAAVDKDCATQQAGIKETYKDPAAKTLLDEAMAASVADCAAKRTAIEDAYVTALADLGGSKGAVKGGIEGEQKILDSGLQDYYTQSVQKPVDDVVAKYRTTAGHEGLRKRGVKTGFDGEGARVEKASDKPLYRYVAGSTVNRYLDERWVKGRTAAITDLVQAKEGLNFGQVTGYDPDKKDGGVSKQKPEEPSFQNVERFIVEKDLYDWLSKKPAAGGGTGEVAGPVVPPAVPANESAADRETRLQKRADELAAQKKAAQEKLAAEKAEAEKAAAGKQP